MLKNSQVAKKFKIKYHQIDDDPTLTKTERALLTLHQFQQIQTMAEHEVIKQGRNAEHVQLQQGVQRNIRIVGKNVYYCKINCKNKIYPIRLHFKNVRNIIRFYASFTSMFPSLNSCQFNMLIDSDIHRNYLPPLEFRHYQTLFITLEVKNKVGMLNIKFQFYNTMLHKIKTSPDFSKFAKRSVSNSKFTRQITEQKLSKSQFLKTRLSQTNFLKKHNQEIKDYPILSQSRRYLKTQAQENKNQYIKSRKQDYYRLKQKQRALITKASQLKEFINHKQTQTKKQSKFKIHLTLTLAKFIRLALFFSSTKMKKIKATAEYSRAQRVHEIKKIFVHRLLERNKLNVNSRLQRNLSFISYTINLVSSVLVGQNSKRINKVITNFLKKIEIPYLLNNIFFKASETRRKIRLVQMKYKQRFQTRLVILISVANDHIKQLLDKHPYFKTYMNEWNQNKETQSHVRSYIKQTIQKFNEIYLAWLTKDSNALVIKSGSKFVSSQSTVEPYSRIYRDINILKTDIRAWFQLQHRKLKSKSKSKKAR